MVMPVDHISVSTFSFEILFFLDDALLYSAHHALTYFEIHAAKTVKERDPIKKLSEQQQGHPSPVGPGSESSPGQFFLHITTKQL